MANSEDEPITPDVIIPNSDFHIKIGSTITINGTVTPYTAYSGNIPVRIKVDDGNTPQYLDVETDSDGEYSVNYTFESEGLHTFTAYVGSDHSNSISIYCYLGSIITLTAPEYIFDNESVTISGVLTYNNRPITSSPVKIYEGNTLIDTVTTDEYGAFSKSISNVSHGIHSFKAVYDGADYGVVYYDSCESIINIEAYEPMILNIVGDLFQYTPQYGSDLLIDYGDGTRVEHNRGAVIHEYATSGEYTVKMGEVTTLEIGSLYNLNNLTLISIPSSVTSMGNYCLGNKTNLSKVIFNWVGNSIIPYNSTWMNSPLPEFIIPMGTTNDYIAKGYPSSKLVESTTLTVTSDKNIIMTGETATITATLEDNGVPVSGETVTFEVRKQSDDSLVETLTAVTDNVGEATVSYLGDGEGNLYIKVECMLLTQTYSIEDCYKLGFKNTTFSTHPASSSGVNITDKTDESITFYEGGAASISQTILNSSNDWEFSFTVVGNQVTSGGVSFGIQSDNEVSSVDGRSLKLETREYYGRKVINLFIGSSQYGHRNMTSNPQSYDVKFVKEGTTVKGYVDGSLITTVNNLSWLNDSMHILLRTWGTNTTFYQTVSNFKIKKL